MSLLLARIRPLQQLLHVTCNIHHWRTTLRYHVGPATKRNWSSSSALDRKSTRLPRTLYRQLLKWCQNMDPQIPLGYFIEPFSLAPPQNLDQDQFQALLEYHQKHHDNTETDTDTSAVSPLIEKVHEMLQPCTSIRKDQLFCQIQTVSHLRNLIRAVFRLNNTNHSQPPGTTTNDDQVQKSRIAYAFQTLRTLNELSEALDDLSQHRQDHSTRGDDIQFFVGQVVQHKHERWRGVIAGWDKPDSSSHATTTTIAGSKPHRKQLSSLTTKIYTARDFLKAVRYEVILDLADMHTLKNMSPLIVCTQQDLETIQDDRLYRIRSKLITQNFKGFDPVSNTFCANDLLAYEYPADYKLQQQAYMENGKNKTAKDTVLAADAAADEIVGKIQSLMAHLEQMIPLPADDAQKAQLSLLQAVRQKLVSHGDNQANLVIHNDDASSVQKASSYLRFIYEFTMELRDMLWHRKTFQELTVSPKFQPGEVVYHEFFGFRGVVVACDHVPKYNVRYWDGVRHIDNVLQKPFYHVLPDQEDCMSAFGGPRGMRYVCQDNLVACHSDRTDISVALDSLDDPGWSREMDALGKTVFKPSIQALFKHGADIGDNGVTSEVLQNVVDELRLWQVASRDQVTFETTTGAVEHRLSLPSLFLLLAAVTTLDAAEGIELMIKDTFKCHRNPECHRQLEKGLTEMMRGNHEEALQLFTSLVEEDPDYAEGWNWLATCEYLRGKHASSINAAVKALELQPMNFQTQSGIGLCLYDMGKYEEAAAAFRQCLDLDPWSPVSTRLSACIDILNRRKGQDEKQDE